MPSISTFADPSAAQRPSGTDGLPPRDVPAATPWPAAGWEPASSLTAPILAPDAPPVPIRRPRPRPTRSRRAGAPSPYSFTAVLASLVALTTAATALVVTAGSIRIGAAASDTTPFLADRPQGPAVVADPPGNGSGGGPLNGPSPERSPTTPTRPTAPRSAPTDRPEPKDTPPAPGKPPAGRPPETSPEPRPVPDGTELRRWLLDLCTVTGLTTCGRFDPAATTTRPSATAGVRQTRERPLRLSLRTPVIFTADKLPRHQSHARSHDQDQELRQQPPRPVPVLRKGESRECRPAAQRQSRPCDRQRLTGQGHLRSR